MFVYNSQRGLHTIISFVFKFLPLKWNLEHKKMYQLFSFPPTLAMMCESLCSNCYFARQPKPVCFFLIALVIPARRDFPWDLGIAASVITDIVVRWICIAKLFTVLIQATVTINQASRMYMSTNRLWDYEGVSISVNMSPLFQNEFRFCTWTKNWEKQ